jgi:hypothetical protein
MLISIRDIMNNKHKKTLAKINAKPTPKNVTWAEVKSLVKNGLKGTVTSQGGSAHTFRIPDYTPSLTLHKPHPQNTFLICYVQELRDFLKDAGVQSGIEDE